MTGSFWYPPVETPSTSTRTSSRSTRTPVGASGVAEISDSHWSTSAKVASDQSRRRFTTRVGASFASAPRRQLPVRRWKQAHRTQHDDGVPSAQRSPGRIRRQIRKMLAKFGADETAVGEDDVLERPSNEIKTRSLTSSHGYPTAACWFHPEGTRATRVRCRSLTIDAISRIPAFGTDIRSVHLQLIRSIGGNAGACRGVADGSSFRLPGASPIDGRRRLPGTALRVRPA